MAIKQILNSGLVCDSRGLFALSKDTLPVHGTYMTKSYMREGMQRGLGVTGFEATLHDLNQR